jgi:hypothetical protein
MNEFSINGGAYIGNTNASRPFATLKATRNMLMINMGFAGQVFFNAEDIVLIEHTSTMRGSGIKITHNVQSYPKKVIFITGMQYYDLLENIKATGFFNKESLHDQSVWYEIKKLQEQGRYPVKTAAIILFIAGWNIPFLIGIFQGGIEGSSRYAPYSTFFAIVFIVLVLISEPFRMVIFKEGRDLKSTSKSLYLLLVILVMLLVSSIVFSHLFNQRSS